MVSSGESMEIPLCEATTVSEASLFLMVQPMNEAS